jgi:HemY protein
MRGVVWLVLIFTTAVVAALTLGDNDGLVSFYWAGRRVDLSLNLFLVLLLLAGGLALAVVRGLQALLAMPQKAQAWREQKRERAAQAALREAQAELLAGRYSRSHKAAQRALAVQPAAGPLATDTDFTALAQLLAASSLHRLQDRPQRDTALAQALAQAQGSTADGARLLGAEWALDDGQAERADTLLRELPPGVARRTHALRLRLRAARQARQPLQALHMARMLANHQAFTAVSAKALLRTLAQEVLDGPRDAEQLRRTWAALDNSDRRDPAVVAHAARRAVALGHAADARAWLRPLWDRLADLAPDERADTALALADASDGITSDWLPRLEQAQAGWPQDGAVQAAVGRALAARGLWGKARRPLEAAAADTRLANEARRHCWRTLAGLAREEGDTAAASRCDQQAAALD